jgi:hypothetical protein
MMKNIVICISLSVFCILAVHAQVENVPANHRVYDFLQRMEVKQILPSYHGTVIPISRKKIAEYIDILEGHRGDLRGTDLALLDLYRLEFSYDLGLGIQQHTELLGGREFRGRFADIATHKQKYLYTWTDDYNSSLFIDALAAIEHRSRSGDQSANLTLMEAGGRIRGTLGGRIGYYLDGINGVATGDRNFALEDQRLLTNSNFRLIGNDYYDESMGYVRVDATWFGFQAGRERLLWRESYGHSLILSNNPPMFDFLRFDASYGVVNYNFIHGWIMGPREFIEYSPDHRAMPHNDQKYFVAHRVEFSLLQNRLQIGLNETLIYARESPELGYLNPVSFLISTERNLGDRDKLMLGIDFAMRPVRDIELKFGALFDDIHFGRSFTRSWDNRWAIHGGVYYADPLGLQDVDFFLDYTRIEPYVYAHHRSPDRYYAHTDFGLGHPLGPNSDDIVMRIAYRPQWQWQVSLEFQRERHGGNIVDAGGNVIRNVGGDLLFPFRPGIDSREKRFLDGVATENFYYRASVRYEIFKQILVGGRIEYANLSTGGDTWNNLTVIAGIWVDY